MEQAGGDEKEACAEDAQTEADRCLRNATVNGNTHAFALGAAEGFPARPLLK